MVATPTSQAGGNASSEAPTPRDLDALNERIADAHRFTQTIMDAMGRSIVGQRYLLERLVTCLLANGHVLLEGVPGLAKTRAVTALAQSLDAQFQRVQFTPDLLPADLIGTQIYQPNTGDFRIRKGPLFANIVLADEINRAPAKVQSALLEAMQEGQVTIGEESCRCPSPFSCWPPRIRSSRKAPIHCPKRRWTASC